ncbi:MAG: hypothetical protein V3V08_07265 [Nannocystaceae bacterium]
MQLNQYWVETQPPESELEAAYDDHQFDDAKQHAQEIEGVLLWATFEYTDSEVVQNFKRIEQ